MTTLLSRLPFDSSAINSSFAKLNDYWRSSDMTTVPTVAATSATHPPPARHAQSEASKQAAKSEPSAAQPARPSADDEAQEPDDNEGFDFQPPSTSIPQQAADIEADKASGDKAGIAELIAQYGSSSATSWLEFARYKIWRPSVPIPPSSFPPVQGYLRSDPFVFAWGNPIVSDPAALEATCAAFIEWARSQKLRPIWLCVDGQMEQVLGGVGSKFRWSALSCIVEDFLDPRSVVELAHSHGGGSEVKDFKKNLRRAERANVQVREVQPDQWSDAMKRQVEEGIANWKKSKTGIQIASVSRFAVIPGLLPSLYMFCLNRRPSNPGWTLSTVAIGLPRVIPTLLGSLSSPAFTGINTRSRMLFLSRTPHAVRPRWSSTAPCRTSRTRARGRTTRIANRKMERLCGRTRTSKWPARSRRIPCIRAHKAPTPAVPALSRDLAALLASQPRPPAPDAAVWPSRSVSRRRIRSRPSTT